MKTELKKIIKGWRNSVHVVVEEIQKGNFNIYFVNFCAKCLSFA